MRRWAVTLVTSLTLFRVPSVLCESQPRYVTHPIPISTQQAADVTFCYQCHADKNLKYVHSVIATGTCTSCHTFKTQDGETQVILTGSGKELCLQCHGDKDTAHAKGVMHKPVEEGCTSCHNPHSTPYKNLLVKASAGSVKKDNLCSECHEEGIKRTEKGSSYHNALDMGCETCHITHKTGPAGKKEFDHYLTKTSPALCLDCHYAADPKMKKAHSNQPIEGNDCTTCHDPHGSPAPKLLHANAHEPFAKGQCEKCHAEPKDGKIVIAEGGNRALCYNCHDKKKAQVEESRTKHPVPFMTETCTDCHDPHASVNANLLRQPQGMICANCHEKSTLPVRHGPYEQGQCASCHDPHGSNEPHLLRAKGNNLCRGCHVAGQVGVVVGTKSVLLPWNQRVTLADYDLAPKIGLDPGGETGHPLAGHPMTGVNTLTTERSVISCATCHQAHTSKGDNLIPDKVADSIQLCETCHTKS